MATKVTDLTGKTGNYVLDTPSKNAGQNRTAIVLKSNTDGTVNLVVTIQSGDFANEGRIMALDDSGNKVIVGRVNQSGDNLYYYVNNVTIGANNGEWSEA